MTDSTPSTPRFPFPALAALSGRAALGGDREVALACLTAARLAVGILPPVALPPDVRASRAAGAQAWFAAHALPPGLLSALLRLASASAQDTLAELAAAVRAVADSAAPRLDEGSRVELSRLAEALASAAGSGEPGAGSGT